MATAVNSRVFRFADVEVRERQHRVMRAGKPLAMEPKAIRVLLYLLENPGHVVTKEELLTAVWGDTAVSDNSLTRAVALIRRVLEDDPHMPAFIETLSTAGYRFICPVEVVEEALPNSQEKVPTTFEAAELPGAASTSYEESDSASKLGRKSTRAKRFWLSASFVATIALIGSAFWYVYRPLSFPHIGQYTQLTNDGRYKFIAGTDGTNLYINLVEPFGNATVPVSGGRLMPLRVQIPATSGSHEVVPVMMAVSPDGLRLLVGNGWDPMSGRDLWIIGTHGSISRFLTKAVDAAWSPDNRTIAYSDVKGHLYTISTDGGEPKLLFASNSESRQEPWDQSLVWSPDGTKVRFVREGRYWQVLADGSDAHELLPNWHATGPRYNVGRGLWTPDGAFFLFTAWSSAFSQNPLFSQNLTTQIWAYDERVSRLLPKNPEPIQLTAGVSSWGTGFLAVSKDGSKVYTTSVSSRGELVIYDLRAGALRPYLGGISAEYVDFSKDGKRVVYVTYPDGVMWRANRDGTEIVQLTSAPMYPVNPRWSPDGKQIVFSDGSDSVIYTIASQGGTPRRLLPGDSQLQSDPNWSPDGRRLLFNESAYGPITGAVQSIRVVDLANGKITSLPPSPKGIFSPRWSSDGRYIAAMTTLSDGLEVLDLRTGKWSEISIGNGTCNWLSWSHDSRHLYFINTDYYVFRSADPGIYRVAIDGGNPQKVLDLTGFAGAGFYGGWSGLDPDDNPILLRNAGTREIYALTLEWRR